MSYGKEKSFPKSLTMVKKIASFNCYRCQKKNTILDVDRNTSINIVQQYKLFFKESFYIHLVSTTCFSQVSFDLFKSICH